MNLSIMAAESVSPLGWSAAATASAIRAGISRLEESEIYWDVEGEPIICAQIDAPEPRPVERIVQVSIQSLEGLLRTNLSLIRAASSLDILLGTASATRPGPNFSEPLMRAVSATVSKHVPVRSKQHFEMGNAAFHHCVSAAEAIVGSDRDSICLVGCVDSLLHEQTLDWYESGMRLKSDSPGRNHSLSPGEAGAFLLVSGPEARSGSSEASAKIVGLGISEEHAPLIVPEPSTAQGLTQALRIALTDARVDGQAIDSVICDLDGEHFRSKEWGLAGMRCLGSPSGEPEIWHPADCFGAIGAASGAVYAAVICSARGWLNGNSLVICSDDAGARGASIIRREAPQIR